MKKLSYLLIVILLSSFIHVLPVNSQIAQCVTYNLSSQTERQYQTWLNEPNGLNDRFLDRSESSFERGQRLYYNHVLNNTQICQSDLTQEMIDSMNTVIISYENAIDHSYLVDGFLISRSSINQEMKNLLDPITASRSIFAEAVQIGLPNADVDSLINGAWVIAFGINFCNISANNCFEQIDEGSPATGGIITNGGCGTSFALCIYTNNLTSLVDPLTDLDLVFNYTNRKDLSGGRQVDTNTSLLQSNTLIIQSDIRIDINEIDIQTNVSITSTNASLITDFTILNMQTTQRFVGGGAGREHVFNMYQLAIPDGPTPIIANPTLWGLFNSSDTQYSILSVDGRDKVFQDMQIRLNLTLTDPQGRNNISEAHANFNSTLNNPLFMMSFYNDSGTFVFNTTTPLIVENLEGIVTDITDGFNITFIFSLSDQLGHGYIWLSNANVTDISRNSTIVRERWFSFIREPGATVSGGSGTSGLFPLAPLLQLFFIVGGFWFILQSKNRIEIQATGIFFFLASLLFVISPIYAVIDSNDVLSYVILNYPDAIRNNFVLIHFGILGMGLSSVIINNRSKIGI